MKPPRSEIIQDEVLREKIDTDITPEIKRSQDVSFQKYKSDNVSIETSPRKSSLRRKKSDKQENLQEDKRATIPILDSDTDIDTRGHLVSDKLFETSTSPKREMERTEWQRPVDVVPQDGSCDETPTICVDRGSVPVSEFGSIRKKKVAMNVVKKLFGVHPSRFGMDTTEPFVFGVNGESVTEDDSDYDEDHVSPNVSAQRDSTVSASSLSAKRAAGIVFV